MDYGSVRPLSFIGAPPIEDLSPETVLDVADRLSLSHTFEELVYRESEMDALFSLADIALHSGRESLTTIEMGSSSTTTMDTQELIAVRDLIFRAHDLGTENQMAEGADLLREAARLIALAC